MKNVALYCVHYFQHSSALFNGVWVGAGGVRRFVCVVGGGGVLSLTFVKHSGVYCVRYYLVLAIGRQSACCQLYDEWVR